VPAPKTVAFGSKWKITIDLEIAFGGLECVGVRVLVELHDDGVVAGVGGVDDPDGKRGVRFDRAGRADVAEVDRVGATVRPMNFSSGCASQTGHHGAGVVPSLLAWAEASAAAMPTMAAVGLLLETLDPVFVGCGIENDRVAALEGLRGRHREVFGFGFAVGTHPIAASRYERCGHVAPPRADENVYTQHRNSC
jgi:hypothetical protein